LATRNVKNVYEHGKNLHISVEALRWPD